MTKALVHLFEYQVPKSSLEQLSREQTAILGILSYAVSEVNALAKFFIIAQQDKTGENPIDIASMIHQNVILRTWSAKLFEVMEFAGTADKRLLASDDDLRVDFEEALLELDELKSTEGFSTARVMRNEATSHYSMKAALKNIDYMSEDAECNLYLGELNGNSFYPFGEELMFVARMSRQGKNSRSKAERLAQFWDWHDWNIAMNDWLSRLHFRVVKTLFLDSETEIFARHKAYWVPPSMLSEMDTNIAPLFFKRTY